MIFTKTGKLKIGHLRLAFLVAIVWAFVFFPFQLRSQVLHLTKGDTIYQPKGYFFHLPPQPAKQYTLTDLTDDKLKPLAAYNPSHKVEGHHWLKLEVLNELPNKMEWVFSFSIIPTEIDYFIFRNNSHVEKGRTGFFVPIKERTFSPTLKGSFCKINLYPGEKTTLFFKVKSERKGLEPTFDIELSHSDYFYQNLKKNKQYNGIYVGFILLICIYNLFIFLLVRDRAYIYYSLYLFSLTIFTVYNTGDLADWLMEAFFSEQPKQYNYLKLCVYFVIISYLAFLRDFLDTKNTFPIWDKIFFWLSWLAPVSLLIDALIIYNTNFNYSAADIATVGYTLIFLVAVFAFLVPLSKYRDNKKYFIIGGFLAMGIGALFTIYNRFHTVDFSTLPFRIGTVIEVVIFSLGLAYRQQESERQKQAAKFELEKSRIFQEQKEKEAARLEELAEAKNKFYTDITHEFRTPLTVILGMADQLESECQNLSLDEEKARKLSEAHAFIKRNGEQLIQQINQLLDLSKLDSNLLQVDMSQEDIVPYLKYLLQSFYSVAEANDISLGFHPETEKLVMDFDKEKIRHIINNLLSNALKFTEPGGSVDLSLSVTKRSGEKWIKMEVADTGLGIKAEELPAIFERYFQGSSKTKGGTGIGLSLTKELIELFGGNISVKSEWGVGSVFSVFLPVKNEAKNTRPLEPETPKTPDELGKETDLAPLETTLPTLLLMEDNRDVASYIQRILENGYQFLWAKNGAEGIEMAIEHTPDLIISDVMMPEKDGYEVCETLKSDDRTSHIPIIILTAKSTEADKLSGLKVGADAYLMKPFNKEELLIRLEKLHDLRRALREKYAQSNGSTIEETTTATEQNREAVFLKKLSETVEAKVNDQDFGVTQLCRAAGMSNSQLNRKLKALTGGTPSRFIRRIRLEKAKQLLHATDMNVSEVAYQVGFNDPNYFTRLFSEEFGHPPSKIRK